MCDIWLQVSQLFIDDSQLLIILLTCSHFNECKASLNYQVLLIKYHHCDTSVYVQNPKQN